MGSEYLTWSQIEQKYPNEWVLMDRPKTDQARQVLGGHVLFHSDDKLAVYDHVGELPRPFDIAVLYTGRIPDDVIFLL